MNINNLIGKVANKADLIGKLYGYLGPMAKTTPGDPLTGILTQHEELFTRFNIPTFDGIKAEFESWTKPIFKMALMAYIGGEVVSMFNARWGKALKKAGEGIGLGAVGSTVVMASGGRGNPGHSTSGGNSETWKYQA